MSRVINPETAGKERNRLTRAIVLSIRELMGQNEPNDTTRDLAAFISLALIAIDETIDSSVAAWEKRGYWVKADRYRMEWLWSGKYGKEMGEAVLNDDWQNVAIIAAKTAEKLKQIKIPQRHRLGKPWVGAYHQLRSQQV